MLYNCFKSYSILCSLLELFICHRSRNNKKFLAPFLIDNFKTFYQTLVFLNNDERWNNLRNYCFKEYGVKVVTFIFGLVISFICPFMFRIQNMMLGLALTNRKLNKDTVRHVLKSMKNQLVIIHDLRLFETSTSKKANFIGQVGKLVVGYFAYILPVCLVGYFFLLTSSESFICQDMKAPFLLNNSFPPAVNMNDLYELRRSNSSKIG